MNGVVLGLLRSPLRGLFGARVCGLRFVGRRTRRLVELPVEYVRADDRLVVLAAHGRTKTWWRNFRVQHRVDVLLGGQWHAATGIALLPGDAGRVTALARYRARRPRVPADTDDPVVVIEPCVCGFAQAPEAWWSRLRLRPLAQCPGFTTPAVIVLRRNAKEE